MECNKVNRHALSKDSGLCRKQPVEVEWNETPGHEDGSF